MPTQTKTLPGRHTQSIPGFVASWRGRVPKELLAVAAVAALSFIAWFRLPALTRSTVWAEDGGVFLRDVLSTGKLRSIPIPYDGYLHVVPRSLASVAATVAPVDAYATAISFLSCVVVAAVAVMVFFLSRAIVEPAPLRVMLAVIPILLPVGPQEVLGNAANLHWYLLWLAPWLLLHKPATVPGKVFLFVAALMAATSEIITGLFLPLALWAVLKRRNYWGPTGLLLGVALQILTTLAKPRFETAQAGSAPDPLSVIYGFFLLPVGSIWHADSRTLGSKIASFGGWALFIPVALMLVMVVYTVVVGRLALKLAALGTLGAAAACWTAAVVLSGNDMFDYANYEGVDWTSGFGYIRYAAAPAMFLLGLVPLFVAAVAARHQVTAAMPLRVVAAVFVVGLLASYFPSDTTRRLGPSWPDGVAAARASCTLEPAPASSAALVAPPIWKFAQVQIPCDLLRRH